MNSLNTSNYLFQASKQASKKLTFGIDESHSGLKNLRKNLIWSQKKGLKIAQKTF